MVSDYWGESGSDWQKFQHLAPSKTLLRIAAMPLFNQSQAKDSMSWKESANGSFLVQSAYSMLQNLNGTHGDCLWNHIWSVKGTEHIRAFLWLVGQERILTNKAWTRGGMTDDASCSAYGAVEETALHPP